MIIQSEQGVYYIKTCNCTFTVQYFQNESKMITLLEHCSSIFCSDQWPFLISINLFEGMRLREEVDLRICQCL